MTVGYLWLWWAVLQLDRSRHRIDGVRAQQWTAGRLRRTRRRGWPWIDDGRFERFNVDHVWFGPPGVIAIETKYTSHPWTVTGTGLAGPLPTEDPLGQARAGARKIHLLLRSYGIEVPVLPALAVWGPGATELRAAVVCEDVLVLPGRHSGSWMNLPGTGVDLDRGAVERIDAALRDFVRRRDAAQR